MSRGGGREFLRVGKMAKEKSAALNFGCNTHGIFDERHGLRIDPPRRFKQQLRLIHVAEYFDQGRLVARLLPGDEIVFEDGICGRGNFARGCEQVVVLRR